MYHSPKYWKEMARARKEHEAKVRFAKDQASSDKPQATSLTAGPGDGRIHLERKNL